MIFIFASVLFLAASPRAQGGTDTLVAMPPDSMESEVPHLDPPDLGRFLDAADSVPAPRSAALAGSLSLVLPGAGQLYCRRYVKGGIFLAAEGVAGAIAAQRYWYSREVDRVSEATARTIAAAWVDSFAIHLDSTDSLWRASHFDDLHFAQAEVGLKRHDRLYGEFTANQALAWTVGIHVFNVLDAMESSRQFDDDRIRKPARAALLSAVPFLGLGQIYNGTYSRTGLVMMSQGCLAFMAWNNQRLMDNAAAERLALKSLRTTENASGYDKSIVTWDGRYREAFTRRNTYLWYFVLFYFYGVADAAIDAQLHDFKGRMRIAPLVDLDARGKSHVGLSASGTF